MPSVQASSRWAQELLPSWCLHWHLSLTSLSRREPKSGHVSARVLYYLCCSSGLARGITEWWCNLFVSFHPGQDFLCSLQPPLGLGQWWRPFIPAVDNFLDCTVKTTLSTSPLNHLSVTGQSPLVWRLSRKWKRTSKILIHKHRIRPIRDLKWNQK